MNTTIQELSREDLVVDRLYYDDSRELYFVSAGGGAVWWYTSLSEAVNEHGDFATITHVGALGY